MEHIEDILDHIVNDDRLSSAFSSEKTIFSSINRQVKKGSALTERQYLLVKSKILEKQEHLDIENLETIVSKVSMPFRHIDRSQYVSIVKEEKMFNGSPSIKIRFPFKKKTIVDLERIVSKHRHIYKHDSGSHEHYFKLCESVIVDIVDTFSNKNFVIDNVLIEYAQQIREYMNNLHSFVPGVYNYELCNFKEAALKVIQDEIGTIDNTNVLKLKDRQRRYGIAHIDCNNPGGLVGHLSFRLDTDVLVDPDLWSIDNVVESLIKLDRFPLLVLVDDGSELEQVSKVYNAFKNVVPNTKQVCLFRVETTDKRYNLNNFIQDQQFNTFLDNTIDIVYIVKSKLPKLLLRVDWKPICTYSMSSARSNKMLSLYVEETSDMIIYHDKEHSPFRVKNAHY